MISFFVAVALTAATLPPGGVLPDEQASYDSMLAGQARAAEAAFAGSSCADAKVEVARVTPWQIANQPDLIVWREKVRVTGCGRSSVENVNVGRLGGSPPWRMSTGLPGDSLAEMNLQQSAYAKAIEQALQGLSAGCKLQLMDIYVAGRPGDTDVVVPGGQLPKARKGHPGIVLPDNTTPLLNDLNLSAAWMEVWPFKVCDQDRTLGLVFIPRKDGTSSLIEFLPVWQQIEANGPGARPEPVSAEE